MPHMGRRLGHFLDRAPGERTLGSRLHDVLRAFVCVMPLEEQPVLTLVLQSLGAHQVKAPAQLLPREIEDEMSLLHARVSIPSRRPRTAIPHQYGSPAVLALGNDPLEVRVIE